MYDFRSIIRCYSCAVPKLQSVVFVHDDHRDMLASRTVLSAFLGFAKLTCRVGNARTKTSYGTDRAWTSLTFWLASPLATTDERAARTSPVRVKSIFRNYTPRLVAKCLPEIWEHCALMSSDVTRLGKGCRHNWPSWCPRRLKSFLACYLGARAQIGPVMSKITCQTVWS